MGKWLLGACRDLWGWRLERHVGRGEGSPRGPPRSPGRLRGQNPPHRDTREARPALFSEQTSSHRETHGKLGPRVRRALDGSLGSADSPAPRPSPAEHTNRSCLGRACGVPLLRGPLPGPFQNGRGLPAPLSFSPPAPPKVPTPLEAHSLPTGTVPSLWGGAGVEKELRAGHHRGIPDITRSQPSAQVWGASSW